MYQSGWFQQDVIHCRDKDLFHKAKSLGMKENLNQIKVNVIQSYLWNAWRKGVKYPLLIDDWWLAFEYNIRKLNTNNTKALWSNEFGPPIYMAR